MNMRQIARKVERQERLSEDDALFLFESNDLLAIGELAHLARQRKNGSTVYYNVNRHINPTNICALSCKFCAFSRKPGEAGAYAYSIDDMLVKAKEAVAQGATELHMVGGLHPRWSFKHYRDMIAALHEAFPAVHLKAFTVVELDWMARRERRPIADILVDLKDAGLGSLPGGGAEIFHPEVRDVICDTKVSAEQWIDTHRLAHHMGMRSNSTMLYGHIEKFHHRVDHMRRLRELQDETKGFNVFIPLAFQPFDNDMGINRYTFGIDDLKTVAVARLYLDNFANIKAYWVMLGQDAAQLALHFGANDLDGTVTEEKISAMAGGRAGIHMSREGLEDLIRRGGFAPVERDTLYRPIRASAESLVPKPAPLATGSLNITDISTALQDGRSLRSEELIYLYDHLDLLSLGQLTALRSAPHTQERGLSFTTAPLLDISTWPTAHGEAQLKKVLESCEKFYQEHKTPFALRGLEHLSVWLQDTELFKPVEFFARLRQLGVTCLEESWQGDIGLAQRSYWHLLAHEADLTTAMTFVVPHIQASNIHYVLTQLAELPRDLRHLPGIRSLHVVSGSGELLIVEFLRILALARLAAPSAWHISTPLEGIPLLSPRRHTHTDAGEHPALKIASLLHCFGADDLSLVNPALVSIPSLVENLKASGKPPRRRDLSFNEMTMDDNLRPQLESLSNPSTPLSVTLI